MRARILGLVLLLPTLVGAPAGAGHDLDHWQTVTFDAPLSCGLACANGLAGFEPCSNPFPPGAYADVVVTAPEGATLLEMELFPVTNWDSFACEKPEDGNDGRTLGVGANVVGEPCGHHWPSDPAINIVYSQLGCHEKIVIPAEAGASYVLRAYKFLDAFPAVGRYRFR